jgi:penicillin-binding protein 1A
MPAVPSIALGSSSISLMEMTAAYACFANEGISTGSYFIEELHDLDGKVYDDFKPIAPARRAMSQETAQLVTSMLRTVVQEGTASRLRWKYGVYNEVAGKTGTTQQNADGWFMAITPHLAMGAWVGADDPRIRFRSTELGQGSNTALPITAYFLKQVERDKRFKKMMAEKFPPLPPDLQERLNCDLYELDYDLRAKIERLISARDSAMEANPLGPAPPVTFLQMLYERKLRIMRAALAADSIKRLHIDIVEGADDDHE